MQNQDTYLTTLDQLEQAGNYEAFYIYWNENDLWEVNFNEPFTDYHLVYDFSKDYSLAVAALSSYLSTCETDRTAALSHLETFTEHYSQFMTNYDTYIINTENLSFHMYEGDNYNATHLNSVETMRQYLNGFVVTYFHIPQDEIEDFQHQSKVNQYLQLEEHVYEIQN